MAPFRTLAVAAAYGRVGYVFIVDGRLMDWRMSRIASRSPVHAVGVAQKWINELHPNVVVTAKPSSLSRKGSRAKEITAAITALAAHNYVLDVSVVRTQEHKNKYEEAAALVALYPDLKPWQPKKRRFFDKEPRATVLFEALALALIVMKKPATTLAAGMG